MNGKDRKDTSTGDKYNERHVPVTEATVIETKRVTDLASQENLTKMTRK